MKNMVELPMMFIRKGKLQNKGEEDVVCVHAAKVKRTAAKEQHRSLANTLIYAIVSVSFEIFTVFCCFCIAKL